MFPTEWKVAESMELDLLTDILYVFFVNEPFNGFVKLEQMIFNMMISINLYFIDEINHGHQ